MTRKLTIGVLGGMGPQATVDFLGELVARTPARRDQDHLRVLIDNNPGVPDRQAALHGDAGAVRRVLRDMALGLEAQGADFLVMPCNTAHAYTDELLRTVTIPFLSIIDVTVQSAAKRVPQARRLGLLATGACIEAGVYRRAAAGLEVVVPEDPDQGSLMELIAAVKGGDTGTAVREGMTAIASTLADRGVDVLIAGCTEIPLVLNERDLPIPLVSSTDELAQRAVDCALGRAALPQTETEQERT